MTDMRSWYTSGDGCDVASGDEYHHGYTVHARASDPETAQLIADAVNLKHLINRVGSDDLWRFTSALKWMREGSKHFTLHPEGVSFEWNGGRAGWPGPWMKHAPVETDDACYVCGRSPAPHQTNGGPMCDEDYQAKREAGIKWDEANERTGGLGAP